MLQEVLIDEMQAVLHAENQLVNGPDGSGPGILAWDGLFQQPV
jgi:hypothetical protein